MSGATIASKLFHTELKLIADPEIKAFTLACFDILSPASHYFWTRPAAKGGHHVHYHPASFRADHGLVGHTSLVAYLVWQNRRLLDDGADLDDDRPSAHSCEAVAAALLHDVMKEGDPEVPMTKERKAIMKGYHGVEMANAILARVPGDHMAHPRLFRVLWAVCSHMGPWTLPASFRPSAITDPVTRRVAEWLSFSDYVASRELDCEIQSRSNRMRTVPDALREAPHAVARPQAGPVPGPSTAMAAVNLALC